VAPEIALQNSSVGSSVEHRAPRFELAHAIRRLLSVQLGHAPVVHVLSAAHGVGEVHAPVVAVVDICECGRNPAFGHHRVCLAEERLAHEPDTRAGIGCFDRGTEPSAACADHENIVHVRFVLRHLQDSQVSHDAHREQANVDIAEGYHEETAPCPSHMPAIETACAVIRLLLHRS